ncbi:MAG: FumA C-terminus/TtdB family hydratase beta subunit [Candidatus Bathyarchaeia archaeon]
MPTHELKTPLSEETVRDLSVRDVMYITGDLVTLRDRGAKRLAGSERPPLPLGGSAIFHCGPLVREVRGEWKVIAAGPTTSMRMEDYQAEVIRKFGVRIVIGKGGMGEQTREAMRRFGAAYLAFTGGAAQLTTKSIKRVKDVFWLDLGMPEAMWILEVQRFGPCIVAIDSKGNDLFEQVLGRARSRRIG